MLSREQLSITTAWGLDTAVSLNLTLPSVKPTRRHALRRSTPWSPPSPALGAT